VRNVFRSVLGTCPIHLLSPTLASRAPRCGVTGAAAAARPHAGGRRTLCSARLFTRGPGIGKDCNSHEGGGRSRSRSLRGGVDSAHSHSGAPERGSIVRRRRRYPGLRRRYPTIHHQDLAITGSERLHTIQSRLNILLLLHFFRIPSYFLPGFASVGTDVMRTGDVGGYLCRSPSLRGGR